MKRVIINGEVLRIENKNYYILDEDFGCMMKVDLKTFKEAVKLYENVCTDTWDKQLRKEYEELVKEIK